MKIGIDLINFYTPPFYLSLSELANARGIDVNKFSVGIGQSQMSMLPPDEDIISMGANAALEIIQKIDKNDIKTLMVATETGIDQSKSAGLFIHGLLDLPKECRVIEYKQACYSSTFALQSAISMINRNPTEKVLIISTDVAKYPLNSSGEATQGCGSVAMIISQNPRIINIDSESSYVSGDVMDFWRPNYMSSALVDGKYSTKIYLQALKQCSNKYSQISKLLPEHFNHYCFHLPFTRMAEKALKQLFHCKEEFAERLANAAPSLTYNRTIGNSYTASLYLSFCSLIDNHLNDLSGQRVGFFSYGSGYVAEFFSGLIQPGYLEHTMKNLHNQVIHRRQELSYQQYLDFYEFSLPEDGSFFETPSFSDGYFRFAGVNKHKRNYTINSKK